MQLVRGPKPFTAVELAFAGAKAKQLKAEIELSRQSTGPSMEYGPATRSYAAARPVPGVELTQIQKMRGYQKRRKLQRTFAIRKARAAYFQKGRA